MRGKERDLETTDDMFKFVHVQFGEGVRVSKNNIRRNVDRRGATPTHAHATTSNTKRYYERPSGRNPLYHQKPVISSDRPKTLTWGSEAEIITYS